MAYSRVFNFVEVNSTFYNLPTLRDVEKWRRLVPEDFQFAVKAHRSITHKYMLQPKQHTFEIFERMKRICQVLDSKILHLQTPARFRFDRARINDLKQLISSLNLGNLRLALEVRGGFGGKIPGELAEVMQQSNVIHSIDLSRGEKPAYDSDIIYTRLFGKGPHNVYQPTDAELIEIDRRAQSSSCKKIVMSFHFVRMYKDAARFKTYKQKGKFPMVTRSTGLSSLEEVLREDANFPSTKQELIRTQGWKLYDLTSTERKRVVEVLECAPDETYNSLPELINTLEP